MRSIDADGQPARSGNSQRIVALPCRRAAAFAAVIAASFLIAAVAPLAAPLFAQTAAQSSAPSKPKPAAPRPSFIVVLDPAHGGADSGAHLADGAAEKDVTLALALRLRELLEQRGFTVLLTRISDATPTLAPDQRAAIANRAHAQACLLLHATSSGNGVHLFTSSLPPQQNSSDVPRSFAPWQTAQSAFITRSIALTAEINAAFAALALRDAVPVTIGSTYLRPMDNLTCPAVAVEVAPLTPHGPPRLGPDNSAYAERVAETLAWSLQQWRSHSTGALLLDNSLDPAHGGLAAGGGH